jgi:hypothetical protein
MRLQIAENLFNQGSSQYFGKSATKSKEENNEVNEFALLENFPNPFNPTTSIKYRIPEDSFVELRIFDILGREIITLINEKQEAGNHTVQFDASNLPSGIYIYRIVSGTFTATKKMILLK